MILRGVRRGDLIALAVGLIVCAGGVAPSAAQTAGEPIKWDMMVALGLTHPVAQMYKEFTEAVRQKTNGRLQIAIRPPGELPYKNTETLRTVGSNRVQIGQPTAFISGESKAASLLGLPLLVTSRDELVRSVPAVRPWLDKDFERYGVRLLWYYGWPIQTSWGRGAPIKSFADFKGRRVRTSSPEQAHLVKQLGAEPVSLTAAEVPEAMNRGVMDVVLTAGLNAYGSKWGDFLQWGYLSPINAVPDFVVVNAKAMDALPADVRAAVESSARDIQAKLLKQLEELESGYQGKLGKEFKVQLIPGNPADAQKALEIMRPYWTTWAKENNLQPALEAARKALGR